MPVLQRLFQRQEEALHDVLQESLTKILPALTPFMSIANIKVRTITFQCIDTILNYITQQVIADSLITNLNLASASYRRMASSTLFKMIKFSKSPSIHITWLLNNLFGKIFPISCSDNQQKTLGCGCVQGASMEFVSGLLLILQQLFLLSDFPFNLLKQVMHICMYV